MIFEVGNSPISKQEEGSVIYFVSWSLNKAEDEVLSLAKLKTIEYWIYWKLREKLWNFWNIYYDQYFKKREYTFVEQKYDQKYT